MTEAQRAAERYEQWNYAVRHVSRLDTASLKRLVSILNRLTPENLRELAAIAEGLADWNHPLAESADAPFAKHDPQAGGAGGA